MRIQLLVAAFGLLCANVAIAQSRLFDFEKDRVGQPPAGFSFALTGSGRPGVWVVARDVKSPDRFNVLAQTDADPTGYRFPVAVFDDITAKDLELSVRFKPVSGRGDQAAGLVWRYRDKDNYYVVRANALEGNVVLYKVENGRRTDLPLRGEGRTYGKKAAVPSAEWSVLKLTARGSLFEVFLNGQKLYEVQDTTFPDAGKLGVWTKADSVTYFDDLTVVVK